MRWGALGLVLVACVGCGRAADLDRARRFDEANRVYVQGDAARAAALYRALVDEGLSSGAVLYNLGNAEAKAGRRGEAIAAYRQALRFRPDDPYLRANLESALGRPLGEERTLVDHLFFWQRWVSVPGRWRLLAAGATLAFALGVAARLRRRLAPAAWAALGVTVVLAASAALGWIETEATRHGVVTADEVIARKGDAETFPPAFTEPLGEGTEFTVVELRTDWVLIRLPASLEAWLPAGSVSIY